MHDKEFARKRREAHVASVWAINEGLEDDSVLLIVTMDEAKLLRELVDFATDDEEYEEIFTEDEQMSVELIKLKITRKIKRKADRMKVSHKRTQTGRT